MMKRKISLDFPMQLLSVLSDTNNNVISPFGIAVVLAMAAEGANEISLNEILSCLGFLTLDELRTVTLTLIENPCEAFKNENNISLMKGKQGVKLLEQFKQIVTEKYGALVDERSSACEPSIQFRNVASFKAEWLYEMERDTEQGNCFQNADGNYSRPVFLSCTERLRYYKSDHAGTPTKAVALPYKLNNVKLPFELVLIDTESPADKTLLGEIFTNMQVGECAVKFPEFSINSEFDLIPVMQGMGLQSIFNEIANACDRIASVPLYANAFGQTAEIKVDKNGTVAKAITWMSMYSYMPTERQKAVLSFNRPFYYFLRHTDTGIILFEGKVNKLSDYFPYDDME